jgi:hypothetical protein
MAKTNFNAEGYNKVETQIPYLAFINKGDFFVGVVKGLSEKIGKTGMVEREVTVVCTEVSTCMAGSEQNRKAVGIGEMYLVGGNFANKISDIIEKDDKIAFVFEGKVKSKRGYSVNDITFYRG